MHQPFLSVVVPCHDEELNLPILYNRLLVALQNDDVDWELILVDDHSRDGTFAAAKSLATADKRVKALRLARNVGSHLAIICGVQHAKGDSIAVLAADLQDPPEFIPQMLEQWRLGNQVVWAVRDARLGVTSLDRFSSRVFNKVMSHIIPTAELDREGVDFFLIDRVIGEALLEHGETNLSVFALLQWMGFRQSKIYYTKQARVRGRSSWSFSKKLKLFVDSIVSFSFLPIRALSSFGFVIAGVGFIYALVVVANALGGVTPSGWASMIVVVLILGGVQIIMLGVLGEYLWRNLAETRRRPRYLVEDKVGFDTQSEQSNLVRRTAPFA